MYMFGKKKIENVESSVVDVPLEGKDSKGKPVVEQPKLTANDIMQLKLALDLETLNLLVEIHSMVKAIQDRLNNKD